MIQMQKTISLIMVKFISYLKKISNIYEKYLSHIYIL